MKKQLRMSIRGEFNDTEFKNLLCDKVQIFNTEGKSPQHVDITGVVDDPEEGLIFLTADGEEEDLEWLIDIAKRGPITSHITKIKIRWEKYSGKYNFFSKKSLLSLPKKRIFF